MKFFIVLIMAFLSSGCSVQMTKAEFAKSVSGFAQKLNVSTQQVYFVEVLPKHCPDYAVACADANMHIYVTPYGRTKEIAAHEACHLRQFQNNDPVSEVECYWYGVKNGLYENNKGVTKKRIRR